MELIGLLIVAFFSSSCVNILVRNNSNENQEEYQNNQELRHLYRFSR